MGIVSPDETFSTYSEWLAAQENDTEDWMGEGDCPACLEGFLDEIWEVDKNGDEYRSLKCRECGYYE